LEIGFWVRRRRSMESIARARTFCARRSSTACIMRRAMTLLLFSRAKARLNSALTSSGTL
jgi:hypothetical protein